MVIAGNSLAVVVHVLVSGEATENGLTQQTDKRMAAVLARARIAECLRHDPAMRWIVGGKASHSCAASPSQIGRFETQWLAADKNLLALADLSGQWIDRVHTRRVRREPANRILQERIGHLLTRPIGRPPNEVRRSYANFTYQAGSWTKSRRVVAKVEWHPGELYPRVGFIVTNMARAAENVGAIKWTRLSCRTFAADAVRLQLHALAYNLSNILRTLATLTTLKEKLIKIGAKVVRHGRYVAFQMAKIAIPRILFADILRLVRLDDNETRISGARPADVTGVGAWEPSCRGFGIAKILKKAATSPSPRLSSGGWREYFKMVVREGQQMDNLIAANWIPVGPAPEDLSSLGNADVSGGVWTIAFSNDFDGQGTGAMFIGTAGGGVWRSTNFTSVSPTWRPLTDHVPSLVPLESIH
jgi:Transposase DDE domain group 1